ncbi:MAG: hypothetical protein COY40_00140, partial [Alphaproteobacteria bacterium CG_4_10_14_0_8_um_filter_53_9]
MKNILFTFLILFMAATAHARTWQPGSPLPQNSPLPATLAQLQEDKEDVYTAGIMVNLGLGPENPTWALTQTAKDILLAKLFLEETKPTTEDKITLQAKAPEPSYKGLTLRLTRADGRRYEEIHLFNGRITSKGKTLKKDIGRQIEYWLWGTARVRREVVMAGRVMPVLTFNQCRLMAQQIVETTPRQCVLADGDVLLETSEPLSKKVLTTTNFKSCLENGIGLINTFPRRCVGHGGRVFTEPPRLFEYEIPSDMPLATPLTNPLDPTLQGTTTSPTAPAPLQGALTVTEDPSPTAPPAGDISSSVIAPTSPTLEAAAPASTTIPSATDIKNIAPTDPT